MHGSSSVPRKRWNASTPLAARSLARRVGRHTVRRAAELGVTKINIDTDGRLVWTRVHREYFLQHPEKFDLRDPGKVFMAEYAKFIAAKNEYLNSAGQLPAYANF
jgi:fructose-bisphosphate aldolase class II